MPAAWRHSCCPRPSALPRRSAACSDGLPSQSSRQLQRHADTMPDVLMPKLSDTMEEGRIIRWLKQQGDHVAIGDVLAEVRTAEGESAPVGAVIAVLSEAGADAKGAAAPPPEKASPKPAAATAPSGAKKERAAEEPQPRAATSEEPSDTPAPAPPRAREAAQQPHQESEGRVMASPLARRLARDRGVVLDAIAGTGPGGRIVERDVEQAAATAVKRPPASEAPARPRPVAAVARPAAAESAPRRVELGKMRR